MIDLKLRTNRAMPPRRALRALALAGLLSVTAFAAPSLAARHAPNSRELDRFMWGLAGQESGWNYYARNPYSGAFGRYQMMPVNWPHWSHLYLGRGWHDADPLNQELVGRAKVTDLYQWLGDWRRVAYWWLTGSSDPARAHWSTAGQRYVHNVMSLMSRAPSTASDLPADPADVTGLPVNTGDWRMAGAAVPVRDHLGDGFSRVGAIRSGSVVRVRNAQWGPHGDVLWLRVRTADGTLGWIDARRTLPAADPGA